MEDSRRMAAAGLDSAAEMLRDNEQSIPGGERTREFTHAAARRLGKAADYVRTHDVQRMVSDIESVIRDNPGPSLLLAAAVGFLAGRAISRD